MRYIILGIIGGVISWVICPIVSDETEPFDTNIGFVYGQLIMFIDLVYIGYSTKSDKKVYLGVIGIYFGQLMYTFYLDPGWILLAMFTIIPLCLLPALGGILTASIRTKGLER